MAPGGGGRGVSEHQASGRLLQRGKPPHLFWIRNDVTLSSLKDQLDQINRQLNNRDMRRVVNAEY